MRIRSIESGIKISPLVFFLNSGYIRTERLWLMFATLVGLGLVGLVGCGGKAEPTGLLPVEIVASDLLLPQLEASSQSLATADTGDPAVIADLDSYAHIEQALLQADGRRAATDSLFALWEADPDHVMWPELAERSAGFLASPDRRAEMYARPACSDTTTLGQYISLWRNRAVTRFDELLPRVNDDPDLPEFAALWMRLKAAYSARTGGNAGLAIEIAVDALPQARTLGGRRLEALVWLEIARAALSLAELDDALHAATMAEALALASPPAGGEIVGLVKIREVKARTLGARRDVRKAFALYDAIIADAEHHDLDFSAVNFMTRAGSLAEAIGRRDLGLEYNRRALAVNLAAQDSLNVPRTLMNIARRLRMQGDLDSCLVYQQRAEAWVRAYPAPSNVARLPLLQAEYYTHIGAYDVVDSLLNAASARSRSFSTVDAQAELHLELMRNWMESGRPDLVYRSMAAIDDLRSGYGDQSADRHVAADLNLLIGEFLTRRSEYRLAEEALDMAAEALSRKPSRARAWQLARNRGILARERGQLSRAEAAFRNCIELGRELDTPAQELAGRFLLGSVLLDSGRYAEAREAFPATDADSFVGQFTTRVSVLLLVGISHAREGDHDRALEVFAEARRACRSWASPELLGRVDLETGRSLAALGRHDDAATLYRQVADMLESWSGFETLPELAYFNGDLRRDLMEAMVTLPTADPTRTLQSARRILPGWRNALDEDTGNLAAPQVVFFVGERASVRWLVTGAAVQWTRLPGEGELRRRLSPVLADLKTPGRESSPDRLASLAQLLLDGVEAVWPDDRFLALVPDLCLFQVPWAALPLASGRGTLIDRGPLVIHDAPFGGSTAARTHTDAGRLLVVAADDVAEAGGRLPTLRHAEREAHDLAALWPAGRSQLQLGTAAAAAFAGRQRIDDEVIHVASHARAYEGLPDQTALLLPGAEADALTATRIRDLDLDTELVFLSCCETGDGRDARGYHAGLARSFLDAGARHVIAPLTVISDEAARELSLRFHRAWLGGASVPEALRTAQLGMRDGSLEWEHPFYWAFYQVVAATEG